ncbi:MAG: single-stranded-DNA-specific exonuclease RecJ [Gammaproteobacteria bacterium]|nr:single-stranded-DNA-specific exonuclease RecJ [Gammaproteobacteria bacterium]
METRAAPDARSLPDSLPALLRRLYAARGVKTAREIDTGLAGLVPVSEFAGLGVAVERLRHAHRHDERIVIVGDFDADGATSSALLMRGLAALGYRQVSFLVPNRFEFGYGLGPEVVALAAERAPQLLITVDNGISSVAGVAEANRRGIDVIVTDHHLPGAELPEACALVNPNLADEPFPHKHLAGVGVAFYLLAALTRALVDAGAVAPDCARRLPEWLDLVALGTVADVVPLDHNNRILVEQGLRRIRAGRCAPGITALLRTGRRDPAQAISMDLAFAAGPRLNAAGRLTDMSIGIACLLADDEATAMRLAGELEALNLERRELEARMRGEAQAQVERLAARLPGELPAALTLFEPDWHQGVVGLIASRIKELYHRPVIAFAPGEQGLLKGSARSVPGLHVRDALDRVAVLHPGLIERFGGHAMAAGLSLQTDRLEAFAEAFAAQAAAQLDASLLAGRIVTDGELDAQLLDVATAELLRAAGPWGQAFEEPSFHGRFRVLAAREVGTGHLRMQLASSCDRTRVGAIAFSQPLPWPEPGEQVELVYRLQVNDYGGRREAQLLVEHLQSPAA